MESNKEQNRRGAEIRKLVSVQASNTSAANSPAKPSAPGGPARMVLAVPDEPARGRKPVLRDEVAAVVTKQQYPRERLRKLFERGARTGYITYTDINRALSAETLSPKKLDKLLGGVTKANIEIRETRKEHDSYSLSNALTKDSETPKKATFNHRDLTGYLYFSQLTNLPLLTREGEVELGIQIEQSQNELKDILLGSGMILTELINIDPRIRTGDIRFVDLPYSVDAEGPRQDKKIIHQIINRVSALEEKRAVLVDSLCSEGHSLPEKKRLAQRIERLRSEQRQQLGQVRISSRFWHQSVERLRKAVYELDELKRSTGKRGVPLDFPSVSYLPLRDHASPDFNGANRSANPINHKANRRLRPGGLDHPYRAHAFFIEKSTGIKANELPQLARRVEGAFAKAEKAKAEMVEANLRIVVTFATKFMEKPIPLADLIQEGNLGLIRAVEKFDYRRGHRFSTYAVWWIRHAMKRAIIDHSQPIHLPVRTNENLWKISRVSRQIVNRQGREPTVAELSKELGISERKVKDTLDTPGAVLSLDAPIKDAFDRPLGDFVEDPSVEPEDDKMIRKERAAYTNKILKVLSKRERYVIRRRYGIGRDGDHTLREIGDELGVSRERIRQIEAEALEKLRNKTIRSGSLSSYSTNL
jgi:RNA polymerase primary sigma factor